MISTIKAFQMSKAVTKNKIIIYLFFLMAHVGAQTIKDDLLAVNKNMGSLKKYSVTLKYTMFIDHNMKTPHSSKNVVVNLDNNNYNMIKPNEMELIDTKNEYLFIDHKNQSVIFNRLKKEVKQNLKEEDAQFDDVLGLIENNYDSLMAASAQVKQIFYEYPIKVYEVNYDNDDFKKVVYTLDIKQKIFKSILFIYAEPQPVEGLDDKEHIITIKVDYENFQINPVISKSAFDIYKYLEKTDNNNFKLKGSIKNYKFQLI